MKVIIEAKTEQGINSLNVLVGLKKKMNFAQRMSTQMNAEIISEDPFIVEYTQKQFIRLPYNAMIANALSEAVNTVMKNLDAKPKDYVIKVG